MVIVVMINSNTSIIYLYSNNSIIISNSIFTNNSVYLLVYNSTYIYQ